MKVSLLTLGCKVNQSEINTIESELLSYGHDIVSLADSPDICIINTCTVTSKSDYQSRQYMRRALKTGAKVYATGCYSQLNKDTIHKNVSDTIEIIDNSNKFSVISKLCKDSKSNTSDYNGSRSRAFVKIQDGCNFRCTYCAIPLARGRSMSKDIEKVTEEINNIHYAGTNEVVLTGIHIGLYGSDLKRKVGLKDLLKSLLLHTSIPRIRLSSLEINEIDDKMLEMLADRRICSHLHIPLQSGDDTILRAMGRSYSSSEYERSLSLIIRKFPDMSIGTDVIVGFPGEYAKSFNNTVNLLINNELSYLHVFPYSKRENTQALYLNDHVDPSIKKERVAVLRKIGREKKRIYMTGFIGRKLDVIVEAKVRNGLYTATSGNYLKVNVRSGDLEKGSLISIAATEVIDDHIVGIPIETL